MMALSQAMSSKKLRKLINEDKYQLKDHNIFSYSKNVQEKVKFLKTWQPTISRNERDRKITAKWTRRNISQRQSFRFEW